MILGIDTSTALTSVALLDGDAAVSFRWHLDARRHAEVIGPMLEQVMASVSPSDITRVVCAVGPGPYTGLRVGVAAARAMAFAWGVPVVGVCSLDAIAEAGAGQFGDMVVATDARRSEVYWARYDSAGLRTDGPRVGRAENVTASGTWLGQGAALHDRLEDSLRDLSQESALISPTAEWIARIGGRGDISAVMAEGGADAVGDLSAHGGDGSSTSDALRGRSILAPQPLYLRRPDAMEVTVAR